MKAWHALLPLLAMTSMGFAFEKKERDAANAELRAVRDSPENSGPSAQHSPSASDSDGKPRARTSVTAAGMREKYQRAFANEAPDPMWAESARRSAGDRLKATVPAGSTVRAIECHASLCRIETSHPDPSSSKKFVQSAFMTPSTRIWNAPSFSAPLEPSAEPGPPLLVSYLAREGRALPAVD